MEHKDALYTKLASYWECRPEKIGMVVSQIQQIAEMLAEWRLGTSDDAIENACLCYSRICAVHECSDWLPFDVMPDWEDDLFCILMDEDAWLKCVDEGNSVANLSADITNRLSNGRVA